jgi:hypothetical protein
MAPGQRSTLSKPNLLFMMASTARTPSARLVLDDAARAVAVADAVRVSLEQKGATVDVA